MRSSPAETVPPSSLESRPNVRLDERHGASAAIKRCYELAYFIFADRSTALEIAIDALEGVRLQCQRGKKRFYWRYTHRKHPVRRITWDDLDLLQWMVLHASEDYERAQEQEAGQSLTDMAIRYIKHLVYATTSMSSFYVNVGVSRLLYNYTTSEAQEFYSVLSQRNVGADEYRRAKGVLMEKMRQRFPEFLKIVRAQHGELRFDVYEEQQRWVELAFNCLIAFTPWSTEGRCREFTLMKAGGETGPFNTDNGRGIGDRNKAEVGWCHALLDPVCFSRLVKQLELQPPETKLALPRFHMQERRGQDGGNGNGVRKAPGLLEEDFDRVEARLTANDKRRSEIESRYVSVVVDRTERARFDAMYAGQLKIAIEEGVNLVEVRGEDNSGKLLLATHVVPHGPDGFKASKSTVILNTGELELAVSPVARLSNEGARASMNVIYRPRLQRAHFWSAWGGLASWGRQRSYAVVAFAAVLIGCVATSAFYLHKLRSLELALQTVARGGSQTQPSSVASVVSYTVPWDGQRVRTEERTSIPEIRLGSGVTAINLDLLLPVSVRSDSYAADLETFTGDQKLMSQNSLRDHLTPNGRRVPIIVPATLLKPGTYYTVQLHLEKGRTTENYRFTFGVVIRE